ncbi:MAG TPA: hypothetical protein VIL61_06750 [Nitrospiria bacterium]
MPLFSRLEIWRFPTWIFFAAVFLASASGRTPSVPAGGLSEKPDVAAVYQLRVEDRLLTQRALNDLVELLGGISRSAIVKDRRPKTIRLEVTLSSDQSAYFLSKMSGLGELIPPSSDLNLERDAAGDSARRIVIDIFDR